MVDKITDTIALIVHDFEGEIEAIIERLTALEHIAKEDSLAVEHLDELIKRTEMRYRIHGQGVETE